MMMLLLISTVAMLASPAISSPTHLKSDVNLNNMIDLAKNYSKSVREVFFVEDVSHLVEAGCEDTFFCKVYDILNKHEHFKNTMGMLEKKLVRNLKIFIDSKIQNCTELLEGVAKTGISKPIPKLLESLTKCIQRKNIRLP